MERFKSFVGIVMMCAIVANVQVSASSGYYQLHVALPSQFLVEEGSASWERVTEVLPGVQIAVENIKQFCECDLQLVYSIVPCVVSTPGFLFFEQLFEQLRNALLGESVTAVGVVGILCNADNFQLFLNSSLAEDDVRQLLSAAISFPKPIVTETLLITSLFQLMKSFNWKNIGIVTENRDTYFSRTAETLYSEAVNNPDVDVTTYQLIKLHRGVTQIQNISKITFLSASLSNTVETLCMAYEKKYVWPNRVWVLHSYLLDDLLSVKASCPVTKALENVLIIRKQTANNLLHYNGSRDDFSGQWSLLSNSSRPINPYAVALHNLVWETALELDLNCSSVTNGSKSRQNDTRIEVVQVKNGTSEIPIATLTSNTTTIHYIIEISDKLTLQFAGASSGYTIIFSIMIVADFIFVTAMLICYVYFRQEPEVKSTSYLLSLLIFLGCYLNVVFLSLLLYFHQPFFISDNVLNTICAILPWVSGLGLATALIVATILVKLIRVYHIFSKFSAGPLGRMSSDILLAFYVVLILSPLILILVIWALVDRFKITFRPAPQEGFIQKQCISDHLSIWLPLLVLYTLVLLLALVIIAIRSRKIRENNFKDTKKVNMFIFCLFFDIILPLSFWWLLENLGTSVTLYIAAIPLHLGHTGIILLCQLLLIAPKVWAPLLRRAQRAVD